MKRILVILVLMLCMLHLRAVDVYTVPTQNLPTEARISVATPSSAKNDATRRYPTVYLLNGHGGNHTSWPGIVNIDSLADAYEVVIVCPDGMNSWYWDSPVDSKMKMETFITNDLVRWADSHLPTIPAASRRAITGLSMGGHGALWLAIRHPDLWGNAGSTSGGVDFTPWPKSWNIADRLGSKQKFPQRWSDHTVMSLLDNPNLEKLNIIFDCGTDDFFYDVNCRLDRELSNRKIPHTFITSPGAHTSAYWHKSIIPQFEYFKRCFIK